MENVFWIKTLIIHQGFSIVLAECCFRIADRCYHTHQNELPLALLALLCPEHNTER